jgi:glutaredoxin
MNKFLKYILVFLLLVLLPISVQAKSKYNIYLFYGETCPHCADEEEFLKDYLKENDNVKLVKYEVWNSQDNRALLVKVQDELNNHASGVPYLVIGDKAIVGFLDGVTESRIKEAIEKYTSNKNPVDVIKSIDNGEHVEVEKPKDKDKEFDLPILGKVDAKNVSLPLIAIVLGFVDGFNPCAMWILLFLITLLINNQEKKKMIVLGLTFIVFSGITYLFFMLTWLNLSMFINHLRVINFIVAIIAFVAGFINLYNFYKSTKKDDGCEVVKPTRRKRIIETIKKIVNEKRFIIALCGIIVLAFSVNIIEMMCSVGLPLIFTQILSLNKLSMPEYCLYMFLYILFFLIDDIVIFLIAIVSFKIKGISTKLTKYSHLVAGIILLIIGVIMLLKPTLLMFSF